MSDQAFWRRNCLAPGPYIWHIPPAWPLAQHQPQSHLVHTAEQLPVEGRKVVGNILRLHSVDLGVSRGDLNFLGEGHLVAGRGTGLGSPLGL